jgi:hypothetical protein
MLFGHRVGAPDGPPASSERAEPGEVDFTTRRVFYRETVSVRDLEGPILNFWDGARLYVREPEDPTDRWTEIPFHGDAPEGAMPYSAPLWLLGALHAGGDAHVVGEEVLRDTDTTRVALTLNRDAVSSQSAWPLAFPRQPNTQFSAHVWLDAEDRIRCMSCAWSTGAKKRRWSKWGTDHWPTTEFWDFGGPRTLNAPPAVRPHG